MYQNGKAHFKNIAEFAARFSTVCDHFRYYALKG